MRNRRSAQRRQIDPVQLPVERQGAGGKFPLLYDRAQRGRHHRTRRTARPAGGNRPPEARRADHDRDRRHRGPGQRGLEGRGAGQQVPGQHPQHQRHHPRAALLRQRQHHPCGRLGRPRARQRNHRHRVAAQRPRNRREPAGEDPEAGHVGRRQECQAHRRTAAPIQGRTRTGPQCPHRRTGQGGTASWWPISTC